MLPLDEYDDNCLRDHRGIRYSTVLSWLHDLLRPDLYFEIGTLTGDTLALSSCESVAVDPAFQIASSAPVGSKGITHLYQMTSDVFFAKHSTMVSGKIDLAFLDGMHHCEFLLRDFYNCERNAKPNSVITMHDCLPLDLPMAGRNQFGFQSAKPQRDGWWTGDVWRTVAALQKFRPDLKVTCLDAEPTGLVTVTNLDPSSRVLARQYDAIASYMTSLDLGEITVTKLYDDFAVRETPSRDGLMGTIF